MEILELSEEEFLAKEETRRRIREKVRLWRAKRKEFGKLRVCNGCPFKEKDERPA